MPGQRVSRIMCAADPGGSSDALERLLEAAQDNQVDAIALVGDLSGGDDGSESYRALFRGLGESQRPTYWVPGPADAPIENYLREAQNLEVVFPYLHGVHGTAAFAPGYVLFAGIGGEISDDPNEAREEHERLRYPRWEAEYRLKVLREFKDHELVMLLWTQPAHKGLGNAGSEVLTELVNTHRPRLVVCGGERGVETLGRSVIVAPGSLRDGHYALANVHSQEVDLQEFAAAA